MGGRYTGELLTIAGYSQTYCIQNNGGSIVKLEKQADFMIDDHIKKDAPQGSYSWKYIEAALKDGRLPAPEDYLIKSKSSIRHVGTSAPGKSTRTPFTAADDDMLLRWVLKGERRGVALLGNELYKDLERVVSISFITFEYNWIHFGG